MFFTKIVTEIEIRQSIKNKSEDREINKDSGVNLPESTLNVDLNECVGLVLQTDPEVLDEINKILDDIRNARQGLVV
jgi:hypothetical protein